MSSTPLPDPPYCVIDLPAWKARLQTVRNQADGLSARLWIDEITCRRLALSAAFSLANRVGVCFASAAAASVAASALNAAGQTGQTSLPDDAPILISQIIADPAGLANLGRVCDSRAPVVLCDHFVQGEWLSELGQRHACRPQVLVEVNLGLNRTGCRPGIDTRHLIRGLAGLPGIELIGMAGTLEPPAGPLAPSHIDSRLSLLTELTDEFPADPAGPRILIQAPWPIPECLAQSAVTDLIVGNLLDLTWEAFTSRSILPAVRVVATVISRSSLERAVLNVGSRCLAGTPSDLLVAKTLAGRELTDVRICEVSESMLTLELGPDSRDLIIGDGVEVIPRLAEQTCRRFRDEDWGRESESGELILHS